VNREGSMRTTTEERAALERVACRASCHCPTSHPLPASIESANCDVFPSRVSLPGREKLWLLATARWRA
jgi:phytoene/squalene synthetase